MKPGIENSWIYQWPTFALSGDSSGMPRGWCLGSQQFRQELLQQISQTQGSKFAGAELKEAGQHKALRVLSEELERRHWSSGDLDQRSKADLQKLQIARRLRAETTVSYKWIAQHLVMGAAGYLSNCLRATKG